MKALLLGLVVLVGSVSAEITDDKLLKQDKTAVEKIVEKSRLERQIARNSRFEAKSKASIYQKMGLRQGDVIKSYDGKKVTTAADTLDMYVDFRKGQVKEVVVDRNGKRKTISVK